MIYRAWPVAAFGVFAGFNLETWTSNEGEVSADIKGVIEAVISEQNLRQMGRWRWQFEPSILLFQLFHCPWWQYSVGGVALSQQLFGWGYSEVSLLHYLFLLKPGYGGGLRPLSLFEPLNFLTIAGWTLIVVDVLKYWPFWCHAVMGGFRWYRWSRSTVRIWRCSITMRECRTNKPFYALTTASSSEIVHLEIER